MRKFLLTACLLTLTAATSTAGPIRNAVARLTGRGCGGCQPAVGVRYAAPTAVQTPTAVPQYTQPAVAPAPVVMPATGQTVHLASYVRSDAGPVAVPGYTPIRVGGVLPTCAGGVCR